MKSMMNLLKRGLVVAGLLLMSTSAWSVTQITPGGHVNTLFLHPGTNGQPLLFFNISDNRINIPGCATSTGGRVVVDMSSELGKAFYTLLVTAQVNNKKVAINGTEDCGIWGDSETVHSLALIE